MKRTRREASQKVCYNEDILEAFGSTHYEQPTSSIAKKEKGDTSVKKSENLSKKAKTDCTAPTEIKKEDSIIDGAAPTGAKKENNTAVSPSRSNKAKPTGPPATEVKKRNNAIHAPNSTLIPNKKHIVEESNIVEILPLRYIPLYKRPCDICKETLHHTMHSICATCDFNVVHFSCFDNLTKHGDTRCYSVVYTHGKERHLYKCQECQKTNECS